MITQKELIQKRAEFWKNWFLEQSSADLNMTIGLVKSMTANACQNNGEHDDTGLYHASILAEIRLQDFSAKRLKDLIDTMTYHLLTDIDSLENLQT